MGSYVLIAHLFCFRHSRVLVFGGVFLVFLDYFCCVFVGVWLRGVFLRVLAVFSTRRCFGFVSMVLACWFGCDLLLGLLWCKFISCCSARLVLLG